MSDQNTPPSEPEQSGVSEAASDHSKASFLPTVGVASQQQKQHHGLRKALIGVGLIVLVIAVIWGVRYWQFARSHVSTDDAFVTGNLLNVSPIVSGTLESVTVDEGYVVRRGQLLARLDDSGPLASVRQARANYNAALSQIPQAERTLIFQQQSTDAAILKAQASLDAQRARTTGAARQVVLTSGATSSEIRQADAQLEQARAQSRQADAQTDAARLNFESYRQAIQTAVASLESYQHQVQAAEKAVHAADARVASADAETERASKDESRYSKLVDEGAVSAQTYDTARAQTKTARANLVAARSQSEEAAAQVEQARAAVRQAQSLVEQARKTAAQMQAQLAAAEKADSAAREQVNVSLAGLAVARANSHQVGIQQANYVTNARQTGESVADIVSAKANKEQVAVRRAQVLTARAQADQARAALTNAQILLNYTSIYAPSDGTVVRKVSNPGTALSPGSPIVTMTFGDYVWVTANFKETQLGGVQPGQSAELEVDAFPGKIFKGTVRSINEATGAATSLLPPENATGNFTKVVQRIPVRIELEPAGDRENKRYARKADIHNLRQGMSVVVTIDTASKRRVDQVAGDRLTSGDARAVARTSSFDPAVSRR